MSYEELETLRKRARNIEIIAIIVCLILSIILLYKVKTFIFVPLIFIMSLVFVLLISNVFKQKFLKSFKETYVLKVLKPFFGNLEYNENLGIDRYTISEGGFMPLGDHFKSSNFISGKYKNIEMIRSDVHIEEKNIRKTEQTTTTSYSTIFKGIWYVFTFDKSFKSNICVMQKRYQMMNTQGYKKVKIDDEMFDNRFDILTNNEDMVSSVLDANIMNSIENLDELNTGRLTIIFLNNKLHIGIETIKSSFEHSIFKKINEEEVNEKFSEAIKIITDFIDKIIMNKNIFNK